MIKFSKKNYKKNGMGLQRYRMQRLNLSLNKIYFEQTDGCRLCASKREGATSTMKSP